MQAAIVAAFGSRMFLWDEFVYVPAFRQIGEGKPWLHWIWQQHNEHRIVWTKLLLFAHAGFSGWNPIVDMYVSALLTALIAWGIWKLYRAAGPGHPAYFVPVALLLCSLAQYMNMLYGLMTCHYFTMAGMVWAIVFLTRRTWRASPPRSRARSAALVSTLNAIVIAPIGLLVLVMTRQKPARWIVWSAAMLGWAYAYFYATISGRDRFRRRLVVGRRDPSGRRHVPREPRVAALGRRPRVGPRARRDDGGRARAAVAGRLGLRQAREPCRTRGPEPHRGRVRRRGRARPLGGPARPPRSNRSTWATRRSRSSRRISGSRALPGLPRAARSWPG